MSAFYDYTEDSLRAWLQEPIQLPAEGIARVDELVHETPQQRHWWPTFPPRRSRAMFSATRGIVGTMLAVLLGGSLLAGLLPVRPGQEAPAAITAPEAASPGVTTTPSTSDEDPAGTAVPLVSATSDPTAQEGLARRAIRANERLIDAQTKRLNALLEKQRKTEADRAEILSLSTTISELRAENNRLESGLGPSPSPEPTVHLQTGSVDLVADTLVVKANGLTFSPQGAEVHSDPGDEGYRTLEVEWHEHDREQRIYIYFAADEQDWWVTEIRTRDGKKDADWLYYRDLAEQTRTPRGETLEMDLRLTPSAAKAKRSKDGAELRIDGMRLTAFSPGSGRGQAGDCVLVGQEHAVAVQYPDGRERLEYFAQGAPLYGLGGLSPAEISERLSELGICLEWRYEYRILHPGGRLSAYSEIWCAVPPAGEVWDYDVEPGSKLLLTVEDPDIKAAGREQHPAGWGCPTDDGSVAPLPDPGSLPSAPGTEPTGSASERPPQLGHVIEMQTSTMLPGQTQRVEAKWCDPEGCEPIQVRWSIADGKGWSLSRKRGRSTNVHATKDAVPLTSGTASIRVTSPQGSDRTSFHVWPRPASLTPGERSTKEGWSAAFLNDRTLALGQYFVLTGWQCPFDGGSPSYGKDGAPGTADDDCQLSPVVRAIALTGSGVELIGIVGPSALMHVVGFIDLGDDLNAAGVLLDYAERGDTEIPFLYVRNEAWRGPVLGDRDGDGDVDSDDRGPITAILDSADGQDIAPDAAGWDESLDLNEDRIIDQTDLAVIDALIEGHEADGDTIVTNPASETASSARDDA